MSSGTLEFPLSKISMCRKNACCVSLLLSDSLLRGPFRVAFTWCPLPL